MPLTIVPVYMLCTGLFITLVTSLNIVNGLALSDVYASDIKILIGEVFGLSGIGFAPISVIPIDMVADLMAKKMFDVKPFEVWF